jgi:hypothetical protein
MSGPFYAPPPYDRADTLLGIAAEHARSGNQTVARAAFDEWQRHVNGERTNWIDDGPPQPLRLMPIIDPLKMGK